MTTPPQLWMLLASLLVSVTVGAGCVTHRDIALSGQYPTDYVFGDVYRTKQDLVGQRVDTSLFRHWDTFAALTPKSHPTPSDVMAQPKHFARDYALVAAHTPVRIERFDYERNMEAGFFVWIQGRIVGGSLAGRVLDVSFISKNVGASPLRASLLMVDTNLLERTELK